MSVLAERILQNFSVGFAREDFKSVDGHGLHSALQALGFAESLPLLPCNFHSRDALTSRISRS